METNTATRAPPDDGAIASWAPHRMEFLDGKTLTFVSNSVLTAAIAASDVAALAAVEVTVFNPPPRGGISNIAPFSVYRVIPLTANDLIYDRFGRKVYASVPSTAQTAGNTITPIDPSTGTVGVPVFVGSEPGKLAILDNGQYLYVSLDGAAAVRRFDLASQTPGLQFSLGADSFFGPYYVDDMEVLPANPAAIAVSRKNLGISPRHAGVAIYDDCVKQPAETARHTGSNVIEFSNSASTLYGYNNETTGFELYTMSVDASGVSVKNTAGNPISGFGTNIRFDNGRIYSTTGLVVDPSSRILLGRFSLDFTSDSYSVVPDSTVGRTFFVPDSAIMSIGLVS